MKLDSIELRDPQLIRQDLILRNPESRGPLDLLESNLGDMNLIGSVGVTERSDSCPESSEGSVLRDSFSAVDLHGAVDDFVDHLGDDGLGHSDVLHRSLGPHEVDLEKMFRQYRVGREMNGETDLESGREDEETSLVNLHTTLRNGSDDRAVLVEHLAKHDLLGVRHPEEHELESARGDSDGTHAVVDTSRSETSLDDLESTAEASDDVRLGDTDVVVDDLVVSLRCVVVSELQAEVRVNFSFLVKERKEGRTTCMGRTSVTPGALAGTITMDCCWCLVAEVSLQSKKIQGQEMRRRKTSGWGRTTCP